tara:strand:+ start:5662 stop:5955 length:294 start_codon:yes stop_codon:yes gene_type:complete
MSEVPTNLIDLGQYPKNDVELIAREFLRCVYLDTLDLYVKDYSSLGEDDESRKNVIASLQAFEYTISVLDGNQDFLDAIHTEAEAAAKPEDEEFERF